MNSAVPGRLFVQKATTSHLETLITKEVLCRGITAEFSSIQDILETAKDIENSSQDDIRS